MSEELTPLSDREMEIVKLLATGATNQQIAQDLVISVNTVKVHLRNIYAKLEVASRTEATMVAVRQGWVDIPGVGEDVEPTSDQELLTPEDESGSIPILPQVDQASSVSLVKRVLLVAAALLAALSVFLPFVLRGRANGSEADPIDSVFPTASTGDSGDRWRTRAQMPTPRNGLAVATVDGLIYAIGGVSNEGVVGKVEIYDPRADIWTLGSPKPIPAGFVSAAVVNGRIYVPGGTGVEREFQDVLEIYDPVRDVWETGAPMPVGLAAYGLAAFDEQLYLFGGLGDGGYVASTFRYDPHSDRWEELESMDQPRGFLSAQVLGGRIYVLGGVDDTTEFNNLDTFDPTTNSWTTLAPMEAGRGGLASVAVRDNLYAIGGGMGSNLSFNERYDHRVDAWTLIETPVTGQWRGLGAAFVYPSIYAIGGWNEGNLSVNEAYQALFQIEVPLGP